MTDYALLRRIARYERQYESLAEMAFGALVSGRLASQYTYNVLTQRAEILDRQIRLLKAGMTA